MIHRIEITLVGCEDETIFQLDATAEEKAFLEKIVQLAKQTSTFVCQPTLTMKDIT